jgi:DNA-directed RNA polymerase specialized sigma24 family protein
MTAFDTELLSRHTGWLRRLAIELLGDSHRADDLLQETWLALLRNPPREVQHERAWLGAVARRRAPRSSRAHGGTQRAPSAGGRRHRA